MKELLTLVPYLRKYTVLILSGLFLVIVANAFSLAPPFLIKEAIDALSQPGIDRSVIARYAGLVLGAALLGGAARYGMRKILNSVSRQVELDLRNRLFQHLLELDAAFYGRMPTGEIMSRATNDIAAVRMVAGPAYMYLANTVFVSIFAVSLMVWIDLRLTFVALLPMIALPPITVGFGNLIHQRFEAIQERFGAMSTMVHENLAGVRIVKAYGQEAYQIDRFAGLADDYLSRNLSLARVSGLFHPLLGFVGGLGFAGVLLLGGRSVMNGSISTGDFVAFMLYLGMLMWPMIALGWVVSLFQRGAASMRRLNEIFHSRPQIPADAGMQTLPPVRGRIEFRNVSFRYPGTEREVLRNVSFQVEVGQMLAVVGATGSGKSALVGLLTRLYDPTAGEIRIDDVPIQRIPLRNLRAAIGMVPQEAFLFSDTIRENLSVGLPGDSERADGGENGEDPRIREAAAVAQFDVTVRDFAGGYDTVLGERGVNLSGGQKQRATLARAIAREPRILILDDALSAVDTHTEAQILRALRKVLRERTSIVVSHRVTAVMDADLIIVLEDGEIVERGVHTDLVARGGAYATLLRRQILAQEVGETGQDDDRAVLAGPEERV